MATKRAKQAPKSGVHLEASRFGTPTPTYYLVPSAVAQMSHREVNAALYRLAAAVETMTEERGKPNAGAGRSDREGWIVQVDRDRACVYLELGDGGTDEAERGMAILRAVERS